jgi:MFS family permease
MNKKRVFTLDFLLVFIAGGLIRICYQMQNTVTPLYADSLGYSAAFIGLLTTVSTVASLILRPFLGGLLDRYSRKWIALIGTVLFAVATLFNGYAAALAMLIAVKAFQGLGFSAHTTAVNTMATDVLPEERLSEGIGYMGLTGSVSLAVAPALALSLVGEGRYRSAYMTAFAIGALAVLALVLFRGKPKTAAGSPPPQAAKGIARYFEPAAFKPSAVMLLLGLCAAAPSTFLAISALGRGFGTNQISLYFTINAVALAVARLFGPRISRILTERKAFLAATVLDAAAFLLVAFAVSPWLLWLGAALYGLGYGTIYPLLNAAAITSAPPHRRGTAMATFLTAMDVGVGLGASFWGLLVDWIGMGVVFPLSAVFSGMAYLLYRWLMKNKKGALPDA